MIRYGLVWFTLPLLLFSNIGWACCSSPLAEVMYEGVVVDSNISDENDSFVNINISLVKTLYGDAPEKFSAKVHLLTLEKHYGTRVAKGNQYIFTLYDSSKYDKNRRLLNKTKWKNKHLALHPYIGIIEIDSFKGKLINRNIRFHSGLEWTSDFRIMNVYFSE